MVRPGLVARSCPRSTVSPSFNRCFLWLYLVWLSKPVLILPRAAATPSFTHLPLWQILTCPEFDSYHSASKRPGHSPTTKPSVTNKWASRPGGTEVSCYRSDLGWQCSNLVRLSKPVKICPKCTVRPDFDPLSMLEQLVIYPEFNLYLSASVRLGHSQIRKPGMTTKQAFWAGSLDIQKLPLLTMVSLVELSEPL